MTRGHEAHEPIAVGPGLAGSLLHVGRLGPLAVNPLPVQPAKIHRPLLRDDILSRERLNGWLERACRGRIALVVGDTGFGKTTFLADWSRGTQRRTSWYRLEPDDRDWLTFIRHLVAGGRELDPGFAPETYRLLVALGPGGPTQAEIVASLAGEMAAFGAANADGFSVILDDYQVIDTSDETDPIVRVLIEHTGPGFSLVIASRTAPRLPAGRLRARGAITRIDGENLCFDVPETDRLFREAYDLPLDPDVVTDLVARTEGWAALLSLVRTNLEERADPDPRALVAQLSATRGDLYDFLAEELLGQVPVDLAEFLLVVSLLEDVTEDAAAVLLRSSEGIATRLRDAVELGLLQGRMGNAPLRFAPLVRKFLRARFEEAKGKARVDELHLSVARHFDGQNWRSAATHFRLGGSQAEAVRVIEDSIDQVLGTGEYRAAADLLADMTEDAAVAAVLRSRLLLQLGGSSEALGAAREAVQMAQGAGGECLKLALLNAAAIATGTHRHDAAVELAKRAASAATNSLDRLMAEAQLAVLGMGDTGSLPALVLLLERLLSIHERHEQKHYQAITCLNLAQVLIWLDRPQEAARVADRAEALLSESSRGYEGVTALLTQAQARAHLGSWQEAELRLDRALDSEHPEGRAEAVFEAGAIAAWFGPPALSSQLLARVRRDSLPADWELHWRALDLWNEADPTRRNELLADLQMDPPPSFETGAAFRWHLTKARSYLQAGDWPSLRRSISAARDVGIAQSSPVQHRLAALLESLSPDGGDLSTLLSNSREEDDALVGIFAAEVTERLDTLTPDAFRIVLRSALRAPVRWRPPLRIAVTGPGGLSGARAATLLELIGEASDIALLRTYSRQHKRSGAAWGDDLTMRLAPRIWIEDLGPISLRVGDRVIDGRSVRRKALGLLVFLASQQRGSATPDQMIDSLWPDLDPEAAQNSMHQTIYFLRRVLEPAYRAGVSPEYLHFDSDVVWLDPGLVSCRSWRCRDLLRRRVESQSAVEELLTAYAGRFAQDFIYEEWSSSYRDGLHAQYLSIVERAVSGAIGHSDIGWRLWVGQQALRVDPDADAIEALVIRLYRALGANAAAAEQYAHYATTLRDQLGVEPPPLDSI